MSYLPRSMHNARDFPAADLYPIFFDTRICACIGSRSRRKTREDRSTAGAGAGRQRDNCPNGSRSSSSTTGVRLMFKEEFHRPTISIRPTSSTAERPLLFGGTDLLPRGRASPERPNGGLEKCCPPTADGGPMVRIHLPPPKSRLRTRTFGTAARHRLDIEFSRSLEKGQNCE